MEVNKEQAEKCRDLGAQAMRNNDWSKAVKMFQKSLRLYPLPGVEALMHQANEKITGSSEQQSSRPQPSPLRRTNSTASSTTSSVTQKTGADGRSFTEEQAKVVKEVLQARDSGRNAHYRVLKINENASDADIKKAYRKLSLKVHPDKNSAPHADEAFKAVGLAYATLSDAQKRTIYDRYGQEDPDNRGGGAGHGPFGGMRHHGGQEMSPEEIFNMFFGGGMPGMHTGGPGVHFYTTGFGGPGMQFRAGRPPRRQHAAQADPPPSGFNLLFQFLPILVILLVSFLRFGEQDVSQGVMPGVNRYFSLTSNPPFTYPLATKLTTVKEIPYFVSDKFLRTIYRDRYQLGQVERMVERAYEQYLVDECRGQKAYKKKLLNIAEQTKDQAEQAKKLKVAHEFDTFRCSELESLFPRHSSNRKQ